MCIAPVPLALMNRLSFDLVAVILLSSKLIASLAMDVVAVMLPVMANVEPSNVALASPSSSVVVEPIVVSLFAVLLFYAVIGAAAPVMVSVSPLNAVVMFEPPAMVIVLSSETCSTVDESSANPQLLSRKLIRFESSSACVKALLATLVVLTLDVLAVLVFKWARVIVV